MRLIGGNISDTPVKEIGDGSAFNVGGGSVMPSLPSLGTPGSITTVTATNWVTHAGGQSSSFNGAFVSGTVKLSDTLEVHVWNSGAAGKIWAASVPYSSGSVGTPNAAQDLSADFTDYASGPVFLIKNSASQVIIVTMRTAATTRQIEVGTYNVSGATFTKVGSISTFSTATNATAALQGFGVCRYDSNTIVMTCMNNTSTAQLQMVACNTVSNQGFGTAVASGLAYATHVVVESTVVYRGEGLEAGNIFTISAAGRILEWSCTPGSTPSVAFVEDHAGEILGYDDYTTQSYWQRYAQCIPAGGGVGGHIVHLETPNNPGEVMVFGNSVNAWGGEDRPITEDAHRLGAQNVYGTMAAWQSITPYFLPFDEDGQYIRGVLICFNSAQNLSLIPCVLHPGTGGILPGEPVVTTNMKNGNVWRGASATYDSSSGKLTVWSVHNNSGLPAYLEVAVTLP
jgi:hypothetical protein